jgi:putative hydrolase of the HAD superfamily
VNRICPIFDLGGVLVEWQPARIARNFSADPALQQSILEGIFRHPDWVEKDRGSLSVPELEKRFSARTQLAPDEIRRLMVQVRASLQLKADTLAWIRELKASGFPLYCLSNMPSDHEAYLRQRYDFWALFDGIVTSNRVGMVKPEPGIFLHLLQAFGLDPQNCVFIDDGPANIEIAQSLGIHGIHFKGAAGARRAFERILERFG